MMIITDKYRIYVQQRIWTLILSLLVLFQFYMLGFDTLKPKKQSVKTVKRKPKIDYYKYPLTNSTEISMSLNSSAENISSSYDWFMLYKGHFKDLGANETRTYRSNAPVCHLRLSELGDNIVVKRSKVELEWIAKSNSDVRLGGYYAPAHCKPRHKVAILVPYRNREVNLAILLRHLHPLLQKQLLEYQIFVIEQYGSEEFNKGMLFNIGFLESQRFGNWQCVICHDVDLIPLSEKILYSCPRKPTHMSAAVVQEDGSIYPSYLQLFGGVTALSMAQYTDVNGYSNLYHNWGGEDDDMFIRVQAKRYPVLRYNVSIAKYAALTHERNSVGLNRRMLLRYAKKRFMKEGLRSTEYKLVNVTKQRLYTHILADVNPLE